MILATCKLKTSTYPTNLTLKFDLLLTNSVNISELCIDRIYRCINEISEFEINSFKMSTLHQKGNKKSAATVVSQSSNHNNRSGPAKKSNQSSQKPQQPPINAWNASAPAKMPTKTKQKDAVAQEKFKEIRNEHLKAAKKYTENYESSSDEEDFECQSILESVFKSYNGDQAQLQKTQEFLEHCFTSGASTCLICIGNVKRSDYVSRFQIEK